MMDKPREQKMNQVSVLLQCGTIGKTNSMNSSKEWSFVFAVDYAQQ